jgi:hypothetical protein
MPCEIAHWGANNSAVDAALESFRKGAEVTMVIGKQKSKAVNIGSGPTSLTGLRKDPSKPISIHKFLPLEKKRQMYKRLRVN